MIKPYWYKFYTEECPVCFRKTEWKERVYTKPKLHEKYDYRQVYDWCEG